MKKHKWEQAWEDKKFNIETLVPSVLVSKYEKDLKPDDWVLDIGCGNGRNSIYLVKRSCNVDCFDVIDLGWENQLPKDLQEKIHFTKSNLVKYVYTHSKYKVVIVARVIQYLTPEELTFLFEKIKYCIKPDGFLLLSYNTQGGIFNREEIDVQKHSYSIGYVRSLLKDIFKEVAITEGSKKSQHVNYSDDILTFDIYASRPYPLN